MVIANGAIAPNCAMASLQNLAVIAPMTFGVDTVENMTMATSVDDITISREVEEAVA